MGKCYNVKKDNPMNCHCPHCGKELVEDSEALQCTFCHENFLPSEVEEREAQLAKILGERNLASFHASKMDILHRYSDHDFLTDGEAIVRVASDYLKSSSSKEYAQGFKIIERASEAGYSEASFRLAEELRKDWRSEEEAQRGHDLLVQLTEKDYPPAYGALAKIYLRGERAQKDYRQGMKIAASGARLGDAFCHYALGYYYETNGDKEQALAHYKEAAERRNGEAAYRLFVAYKNGATLVEKDDKAAASYMKRGADLGYPRAQFALGRALLKGEWGFEKNPQQGIILVMNAAVAGNADAALFAAYAYCTGEYLPIDERSALTFFNLASSLGDAEGSYGAGAFHAAGIGTPPCPEIGAMDLQKAVDAGHGPACQLLADFYGRGLGVKKDANKTIELTKLGAERGFGMSCLLMSKLCRSGVGVPKDKAKAKEWEKKAKELKKKGDLGLPVPFILYRARIAGEPLDKALRKYKK